MTSEDINADGTVAGTAPRKTFAQAAWQIVIADVSMSLDNVLAVAGAARDHPMVLIFGLMLSIGLMGIGGIDDRKAAAAPPLDRLCGAADHPVCGPGNDLRRASEVIRRDALDVDDTARNGGLRTRLGTFPPSRARHLDVRGGRAESCKELMSSSRPHSSLGPDFVTGARAAAAGISRLHRVRRRLRHGSGAEGPVVGEALGLSAFVYAGASQMVGLEIWQKVWTPATILTIMTVTAVVNSRMILLGATLQPWLRTRADAPHRPQSLPHHRSRLAHSAPATTMRAAGMSACCSARASFSGSSGCSRPSAGFFAGASRAGATALRPRSGHADLLRRHAGAAVERGTSPRCPGSWRASSR